MFLNEAAYVNSENDKPCLKAIALFDCKLYVKVKMALTTQVLSVLLTPAKKLHFTNSFTFNFPPLLTHRVH